jgi:hypothetical protein
MVTARRWLVFLSAAVLLGLSLTGALLTVRSPEERFTLYWEKLHGPMSYTEQQLPAYAHLTCADLEAGYSIADVYTDNVMTGMSGDQAGWAVDAAIAVYCPQFSSMLED